jgi:hypothetical protein
MHQFTVPQFIDVEDKIIGPVTVRQFVILLVAGLFLFLEFKLSDFVLFIVLAVPTAIVFGTFAFAKINGAPFHYFVLNFVKTFRNPDLRLWRQMAEAEVKEEALPAGIITPTKQRRLDAPSLSSLSLLVDTGGIYQDEFSEESLHNQVSSFNKQ